MVSDQHHRTHKSHAWLCCTIIIVLVCHQPALFQSWRFQPFLDMHRRRSSRTAVYYCCMFLLACVFVRFNRRATTVHWSGFLFTTIRSSVMQYTAVRQSCCPCQPCPLSCAFSKIQLQQYGQRSSIFAFRLHNLSVDREIDKVLVALRQSVCLE